MLMYNLPYRHIRWIEPGSCNTSKLSMPMESILVEDKNSNPVILLQNEWSIRHLEERNEGIVLKETSL